MSAPEVEASADRPGRASFVLITLLLLIAGGWWLATEVVLPRLARLTFEERVLAGERGAVEEAFESIRETGDPDLLTLLERSAWQPILRDEDTLRNMRGPHAEALRTIFRAKLRAGVRAAKSGPITVAILSENPALETEVAKLKRWTPTDQQAWLVLGQDRPILLRALAATDWQPDRAMTKAECRNLRKLGEPAKSLLLRALHDRIGVLNINGEETLKTLRAIEPGVPSLVREIQAHPQQRRFATVAIARELATIEGRAKTLARIRPMLDDETPTRHSLNGRILRTCDVALQAFAPLVGEERDFAAPTEHRFFHKRKLAAPKLDDPADWNAQLEAARRWWRGCDDGAALPPLAWIVVDLVKLPPEAPAESRGGPAFGRGELRLSLATTSKTEGQVGFGYGLLLGPERRRVILGPLAAGAWQLTFNDLPNSDPVTTKVEVERDCVVHYQLDLTRNAVVTVKVHDEKLPSDAAKAFE